MKRRTILTASALALAASAGALAAIGIYGEPRFAKNVLARLFTDLKFPTSTLSVSKIAADSANNIWFSTEGGGLGSVKLSGDSLERLSTTLPINKANFPNDFKISDYLSAVVFAKIGTDNYFFFSSDDTAGNAGIQWGRYTDRVDLSDPIELDGETDILTYDLATDGSEHLWAATEKGVYDIILKSDATPKATSDSPYAPSGYSGAEKEAGGVIDVSSITGTPGAVFHTRLNTSIDASAKFLFYLDPAKTPSVEVIGRPFTDSDSTIGAMKVIGNELYVAQGFSDSTRKRTIVKYSYDGSEWIKTYVADFFPDAGLYDDARGYYVRDIEVNPSDGTLWLATDGYAFYQAPDALGAYNQRVCRWGDGVVNTTSGLSDWEDPTDDYYSTPPQNSTTGVGDCAAPGKGWRHVLKKSNTVEGVDNSLFQYYGALFMDSGENSWLGSDVGVRGYISRHLALSSTRYVGISRTAVISLQDMEPGSEENGFVKITVGSKSQNIDTYFDASNSISPISFGFYKVSTDALPDAAVITDPQLMFPVDGEKDITVEYFRNASDAAATLKATSSWAEIAPFEDDLMIGGPCFLEALWPSSK